MQTNAIVGSKMTYKICQRSFYYRLIIENI